MSTVVLSPQETRIKEQIEHQPVKLEHHTRANDILARIRAEKPHVDVERGLLFTESFRQTEGEPLVLRWAKALYHYAEKATVYIDQDQLIVGRGGSEGRYGLLYPELDGDTLDLAIQKLPTRESSPFDISPEDARIIVEEIAPYWKGKTFHEDLAKALGPETMKLTYNPDEALTSRYVVNETASFRSSLQWVHDYDIVLKKGFGGLRAEAQERLAQLDEFSPIDNCEKRPFLEAEILTADAIILWANRHADLAEQLAVEESDPKRAAELRRIAETCRWVPEHPARTFYEAMQSQWFTQLFSRIEQKTGTIISNGRMDQYLYPFYKADKEAGRITADEAQELFECMWVDMAQYIDLYLSDAGGAFNEGYAHWEAVTIGGQTPEGYDATNELTYILLKSKREFPLNYPDLAARIHTRSPKRYLREVALTIKSGEGFPKLLNDEDVVPLLLSKGAKFDEALDYSVSGCAECRMPNRDTYTSPNAYINFAAALEMVMYNGRMLKYGDEVLGLETGEFEDFTSFDDLFAAFLKQQNNLLKHAFIQQHEIIRLRAEHFATPLGSMLQKLCRDSCIDLHQPKIPGGIDLGYLEYMGYATVIDSLAAIRKLVFEDHVITLHELKEACAHDFEGYEVIRQLLKNAPSYGNDDPYADEIGKVLDRTAQEFTAKYSEQIGVHMDIRLVPFTSHVPFGKVVSATPDGRRAYTPLSDGSSAAQGADHEGPTAILLSNYLTKNFDHNEHAGRLLNIKLSPGCVAGKEGTEKLVEFIETWRDLKLWHVQFNVMNNETLREAQKHPELYRNLIVRIAGYSAFFTELSKDLQDELISRNEQEAF
ncbi:formate acetyltransferase [Bifidobacterium sp. UTCIF-39]|uniref:(2S)-3-sulfopropanediol dehydratase n=1 Tax=Bifidobacterium sp. UTCIF-39 TaxID=1465359 RepID=UPI00112726A2|nr:pyruvate formate lyase family protein [Bifidobacterium sp. UTCIF-39]TPF96137.1 formate acetyltransferase [Bifidobacterium sp. UTCIF-39]